MNRIDLNGKWMLCGKDGNGKGFELSATVPGCVHTDLLDNGIIKDIFFRDNSKDIQWIENKDFVYKRSFIVNEIFENAYLEFEGLDTYCDIFLNGHKIGEGDNMFTPYEFCVDGVLKKGENELEVRFYSPIKKVDGLPLRKAAFTKERLNTRRIQCTYGWDWVDRFVTMGIWKKVRLAFRQANEIDNIYAFTQDINPYSAQIKLEIAFRDFEDRGDRVHIEIVSPDGQTVFEKDRVIIKDSLYEYIDIRDAKLWYPAGYGEQSLYTIKVSTPTSLKEEKIGIRKVTVLQLEDENESDFKNFSLELKNEEYLKKYDFNEKSSGFIVLVNGIKIMCKGGNWVPCEPFPSAETPDKITRLLELGVDAGVNMLRVWGGGIFECDEFYSECDRLGILVSQDFLMACGTYPEEEEWFIKALQREARAAALRLRNHACLAFWSGDNENARKGNENRTDFPGYLSATLGIEPILREYDPQRYFFPSSPYGGDMYCSATRGTTHNTCFLSDLFRYIDESDMSDYRSFLSKFISRFCAEQASFGMSFISSLKKYLTDEDIFGDDTYMLEYHTKNNPGLFKSLFDLTDMMARKIFGEYESGADRIRKLQMLHCEWTRLSFETYRRHKGYAWGIIYWMFNDCWPAASGWSFLDYYACPKPAYYVFKRCAKPIISIVSKENGRLLLHVSNDSLIDVSGSAKLYAYDVDSGKELLEKDIPFTVMANSTVKAFECDFEEFESYVTDKTIILCDIRSEFGDDRSFFIPNRYCDIPIEYKEARVICENEDEISVTSDVFIPYVMIDTSCLLDDNCFALKAGEIKTVRKLKTL